jgi:hypothetical protein
MLHYKTPTFPSKYLVYPTTIKEDIYYCKKTKPLIQMASLLLLLLSWRIFVFFIVIIFCYSYLQQYIVSYKTTTMPVDSISSIYDTTTSAVAASAQQQQKQQQGQPVIPAINNQEWMDKQSNTKVSFTYSPEIPVVDKPTELRFNIEDINNGTRLKDVSARLTLIDTQQQKQQVPLASYNLTAPDGYFLIKYRFPHEGTYQIIVKANSKYSALALASFKIFVTFQPLGVINVKEIRPLLFPAVLVGAIGTVVIMIIMMIVNKRGKNDYRKQNGIQGFDH